MHHVSSFLLICGGSVIISPILKFQSKLHKRMQRIVMRIQLGLFENRDMMALLRSDPVSVRLPDIIQMTLL